MQLLVREARQTHCTPTVWYKGNACRVPSPTACHFKWHYTTMPLANLLTDVKTTSRNGDKVSSSALFSQAHNTDPHQYLVEIPRGCSIHVFKTIIQAAF